VQDVVIFGHSDCGAMTAIAKGKDLGHLPAVCNWLHHADAAKAINARQHFQTEHEKLDALIRDNVVAQLTNLRPHPSIALALTQGKLITQLNMTLSTTTGQPVSMVANNRIVARTVTPDPDACAVTSAGEQAPLALSGRA
jgi:carbonic anhydrase